MIHLASFLAQSNSDSGGGLGAIVGLLVELALIVLMLAGLWKIFAKAGEPGWAAIVPIYNIVVMLKIVGKPIWWVVLYIIPCIGIVIAIIVSLEVAKRFGKGAGYGIGLAFLPFIFYPLLGFSDAQYSPPGSEARGFPVVPR